MTEKGAIYNGFGNNFIIRKRPNWSVIRENYFHRLTQLGFENHDVNGK